MREYERLYNEARELKDKGDYYGAVEKFLRVMKEYNQSDEATYETINHIGDIVLEIGLLDDSQISGDLLETYKYVKPVVENRLAKIREEEAKKAEMERKEEEKQAFANSFEEYYEYEIETVLNVGHGRVDKEEIKRIMNERAVKGWKLHSVYSNELGKNALGVLGFGVNSTASEDVLIFERRVKKI